MVDISKIKEGDEVTGRHTVSHVNHGEVYVALAGGGYVKLPQERLISHTPKSREIKAGDKVTWGTGVYGYEVFAVCNELAWLPGANNSDMTKPLSDLRHYEP